ncbi:MAG: hypothetical protein KKC23_06345 [Proteobacteria bacterium]|nr:hypothetical protein [Pseudomonadota bacterium]
MSKREQIILGFVALAILYAGYNYLGISEKHSRIKTEEELTDLKNLMVNVATQVNKAVLSDTETFLIKRAEANWKQDPFLSPGVSVKFTSDSELSELSDQGLSFTYSGYLETADKKLAIINNMEYKVGEMLAEGGFVVRSISANRVEIGVVGGKNTIILPLEEARVFSLDKTK